MPNITLSLSKRFLKTPSMPLILNIETSSPVCSVCIAQDGKLLGYRETTEANSHARLLTTMIDELLSELKISYQQLQAVAVSSGPGSYTGLRIGVSVAKGLCYSLGIPLLSVPTLQSVAENMRTKTNNSLSYYLTLMDAKRMDAFVSIFDNNGKEVLSAKAVTLDKDFVNEISGFSPIGIGGNCLEKCRTVVGDGFVFIENTGCTSRSMISISEKKMAEEKFENTAYFEPFYVKEFEARIKKNIS